MNSFDEIMKHAPFLKEVIENKIAMEVHVRDEQIEVMQGTIDELMVTVLMQQMMLEGGM